jgi:hypothetical protein
MGGPYCLTGSTVLYRLPWQGATQLLAIVAAASLNVHPKHRYHRNRTGKEGDGSPYKSTE